VCDFVYGAHYTTITTAMAWQPSSPLLLDCDAVEFSASFLAGKHEQASKYNNSINETSKE